MKNLMNILPTLNTPSYLGNGVDVQTLNLICPDIIEW